MFLLRASISYTILYPTMLILYDTKRILKGPCQHELKAVGRHLGGEVGRLEVLSWKGLC